MPFTYLKDTVVGRTSIRGGRCNLQREGCTGLLGKDPTGVEEFDEKEPGHSGEHEIVFFFQTGGINFKLLIGMMFGIEHDAVRLGVVGLPSLVGGWLEREGAGRFDRRRHGLRLSRMRQASRCGLSGFKLFVLSSVRSCPAFCLSQAHSPQEFLCSSFIRIIQGSY